MTYVHVEVDTRDEIMNDHLVVNFLYYCFVIILVKIR